MENATYCTNYDSQEMNANQFLDSIDSSTVMTIRKIASSLSELGSSTDSISGSPDSHLTNSWDGSFR